MLLALLAIAATMPIAADPTAAAPDGFAACSVIYPAKKRLIHTDPLLANRSGTAALTAAFAANLRTRLYSQEPDLEQLGDCHWEPTSAEATAYMDRIKRNITQRGFTTFWMRYTPAAAN